jgi:hypothetical protein
MAQRPRVRQEALAVCRAADMEGTMFESIKNIWLTLNAIGFFPMVTITGFVLYFLMIQWFLVEKKLSAEFVLAVSFIGQLAFDWPKTMPDIVNVIFMSFAQAVAAIGLYSFADKYGLMDKIGKLIGRKIENEKTTPAP